MCNGSLQSDCQTCRDNGTVSYYLYIGSSVCNTTCPTGQFIKDGFDNICVACSSECITCSVTSTNCTESFLCTLGYYFFRATNSCKTICDGGYYSNDTTGYCEECVEGCALCTAGNLLSCSKCQNDSSNLSSIIPYYK